MMFFVLYNNLYLYYYIDYFIWLRSFLLDPLQLQNHWGYAFPYIDVSKEACYPQAIF